MRAFGFEVTANEPSLGLGLPVRPFPKNVQKHSPVYDNRGAWYPWIREPYTGAWQRNDEWTVDTVLAYHAVYACITLIASDIGKLRAKLVQQDADGIWTETQSAAFSPVLRKPNRFQNHIQFKEWWVTSKLIRGNAYALLERDQRYVVTAMYLLDPSRVKPLVAPDGEVFYQLSQDNLSGVKTTVEVPASEIIHDRMNCLFHPLVGISPIFACGSAAQVGLNAQSGSSALFAAASVPPGILTAPGQITQAQAVELSARWHARTPGQVAVLGNGLTFEALRMTSVDAQLIEHLKWTAETICSVFHVPAFKIGVGTMPTYSNGEILDNRYYSDCLQSHIEHMELSLDEGLGIGVTESVGGKVLGVELDLDGLLRMDTATQVATLAAAVGGTIMSPNEARAKMDLPPTPGGNSVLSQQQNFSLAALAERDKDKPFAKPEPAVPALPPGESPPLALPPGKPPEDEAKSINLGAWDQLIGNYEVRHAVNAEHTVLKALLFQTQANAESLAVLASRELPVPHVTVEGPTIHVAPPEVSIAPAAVNVTVEAAKPVAKTAVIRRPDGSESTITVTESEA